MNYKTVKIRFLTGVLAMTMTAGLVLPVMAAEPDREESGMWMEDNLSAVGEEGLSTEGLVSETPEADVVAADDTEAGTATGTALATDEDAPEAEAETDAEASGTGEAACDAPVPTAAAENESASEQTQAEQPGLVDSMQTEGPSETESQEEESLLQEMDADPVEYEGEGYKLYLYEQTDGTYKAALAEVSDGADIVIPESVDGKTVTAFLPNDVLHAKSGTISSITFPDSIREIQANLFNYDYKKTENGFSVESRLKEVENIQFVYPSEFGDTIDETNGLSQKLNTEGTLNGIPSFISSHYVEGAYYAGKCLVRVDPAYVGDFIVQSGTVCILAQAFEGCGKIGKVTLPESVEFIGAAAFAASSVTEINIPSSVKGTDTGKPAIPAYAFWRCKNLRNIKLEGTIDKIGYAAFFDCEKLQGFDFTKVGVVDSVAFTHAFDPQANVTADLRNTCIGETDGTTRYATFAFSGLKEVILGECTHDLCYKCFYLNKNLTAVSGTSDGIAIGTYTFCGCDKITSFTLKPGKIESWAFAGAFDPKGRAEVDLSESIFKGGTEQFAGSGIYSVDFGSLSTKGDQPYYVEHRMFADCKNLHSVTGGVALDVKAFAFKNDKAIKEFTMKPGFIDYEAFYGAFDPEAKVIVDLSKADNDYSRCNADPSGGSKQFGNSGIAGVDFGDSTDYYVGSTMFDGCDYLTTFTGGEGIDFGYRSLQGKTKITTFTTKPGFVDTEAFYESFDPAAGIVIDLSKGTNERNQWEPYSYTTGADQQFTYSGIAGVDFGTLKNYRIDYRMFADCKYLTSVTGGESIDVLTEGFRNDSSIKTFTMKPGKIVSNAFENAFDPEGNIIIDLTMAEFWIRDDLQVNSSGYYTDKDNGSSQFRNSGLKGVIFGNNSVERIPYQAFYNNKNLTEVTFGTYQKEIGYGAFAGCYALTSDILADSHIEKIHSYGISGTAITELTIPETMVDLCGYALADNPKIETINWKAPFLRDSYSYGYHDRLFSAMSYPESLKTLNIYVIPRNLNAKEDSGRYFELLPSVETINLLGPVEEIPAHAFYGLTSLKKVTVANPRILKKIGDLAFANCGLEETVVMKGVAYGDYVFQNNKELKKVVAEEGVTEIAPFSFDGCTALKEIALPDSLKTVGWAALKNAGDEMQVFVPANVSLIEDDAFGQLTGEDGQNRTEVFFRGDSAIELYHPSSEDDSAKTTEALDSRSVMRVYTDQGVNFTAYKAGASHLPELRAGCHAIDFTVSQKYIGAGTAPDKEEVIVTADGKQLSPDQFDLVYDKTQKSGTLKVKIALKAPYDASVQLLPKQITAQNFYKEATAGTVYDTGKKDLTYTLEIFDYSFTKGNGSTWTKGKDTSDLAFEVTRGRRAGGSLKNLYKEIQIDGKKVEVKDLQFSNDTVRFLAARDVLKGLKNGSHDIIAVFTDGKAGASFTIKEAPKLTVTVTKVWDDDGNEDGIRPSAADYAKYLYIEDQEFRKAGVTPTIKDNGNNTYTITYKGLSPMTDWVASEYVVNELPIAGYTTSRDWAKDGGTMTGVRQRSARLVSGHIYTILSAKDDTFALDIAGGSRLAGANADIYKKNGTEAQAFVISKANDGGWKILNYKGMMLGIAGGAKENGGNLETAEPDGSSVQSFRVVENTDGTITFLNQNSGLALDVAGGKMLKGQNVQQYKPNGSDAQKWVLVDITAAMKKTCPRTWQGTYTIASASNGNYVLDISKGAKSNKANVQIYKANGTKAQKFRVTYRGDGLYSITNVNSGRVLDVKGGKAANKRNVWQYKWNGSKAQLWQITENADGSVTFKTALNVACALDVSGGKMKNKQNVQIYKANGTKAQSWILKKS